MSAIAESAAPAPPRVRSRTPEQRFVLHNVSWQQYVTIGDALPDWPGLRLTYDRGALEFMTTSQEHEIYKAWLGRLVETLAEELNLAILPCGSATFRKEELERGLEPDQCYWIAHERQMRGKLAWDPQSDPPPDLVLEIEVTRSALGRMGIYAALGVPEVWRFDGETLHVHLLEGNGYRAADGSPTFPGVPVAGIVPFLRPSQELDYLGTVRAFRAWVREQLARPQS
jgi:Uma2 family endonuclease